MSEATIQHRAENLQHAREVDAWLNATKVLGNAVHRGALKRLFELWPEAKVEVKHYRYRYGEQVRPKATRVTIVYGARGVHGHSECGHGDQFSRKTGIQIAFRRALQKVRESEARRQSFEPPTMAEGMP